jgi:uncharacterized membrane protein
MKLQDISKYIGLVAWIIAILFILSGVISFFTGEFLNVRRFSNFFWFANSFALLGILSVLLSIALKNKGDL